MRHLIIALAIIVGTLHANSAQDDAAQREAERQYVCAVEAGHPFVNGCSS